MNHRNPWITGHRLRCTAPFDTMHGEASLDAECVSEALHGEVGEVLALDDDRFALLKLEHDGYEGWVQRDDRRWQLIGASEDGGSAFVSARTTLLFSKPDIKSQVVARLPHGARLQIAPPLGGASSKTHRHEETAADRDERFLSVDDGAFAWRAHVAMSRPCDSPPRIRHDRPADEHDPVSLAAALFDGSPYRWGGRTPWGVDCSGLVQAITARFGLALPRDSGDQETALENRIPVTERRRNDLLFWPGHVAFVIDSDTIYHATAHSLDTRRETLAAIIERAGEPRRCCRWWTPAAAAKA